MHIKLIDQTGEKQSCLKKYRHEVKRLRTQCHFYINKDSFMLRLFFADNKVKLKPKE